MGTPHREARYGDEPSPVPGRAVRALTVVSDGLRCFAAMAAQAGVHDRNITGGGAREANHPSFKVVNTDLCNLKTPLRGPTRPSTSARKATDTPRSSIDSIGVSILARYSLAWQWPPFSASYAQRIIRAAERGS